MKKKIINKFDKHAITDLPRASFPGRIITIITPGETQKAVDYLLDSDILGVDTETRPSFKKGVRYQVSLLQVSNRTTCFLFRLHLTGMTPALIRLLEDKTVPKIGLSWHDDLHMLHERGEFKPGWFIDLQDMASHIGIEDLSLQKLYANIFHQKISKAQRLSNWESDVLKDNQKEYAATDAWTCINLYEEIKRLEETGDYDLEMVKEEIKEVARNEGKEEVNDEANQVKSEKQEQETVVTEKRKKKISHLVKEEG
jgi:ribonuclease D